MDNNILDTEKQSEIYSRNIRKAFSNADEMIKTDDQIKFEDSVRKGEVDVVTFDEIKENYGNKFMTEPQLAEFDRKCDELIAKGENPETPLTGEEFEALEKALESRKLLLKKAVPSDPFGRKGYLPIYVTETNESNEGDEG